MTRSARAATLILALLIQNSAWAESVAPNAGIEQSIDAQMKALTFPLSQQSDTTTSQISGEALVQYNLWMKDGASTTIHSLTENGLSTWVVIATAEMNELQSDFTQYVAAFSAADGSMLASGSLPPNIFTIQWDTHPSVHDLPAVKSYSPEMLPLSKDESSTTLIDTDLGQFDEVALKNGSYRGADVSGNSEQMNWQVGKDTSGKTLSVTFTKNSNTVVSFSINSKSLPTASNSAQFSMGGEGNFLVIQTGQEKNSTQLWLNSFEGNTIVRIVKNADVFEFDFDADK